MGLTLTKGDLFTAGYGYIIAHGVNCKGKFASGVAGQIARRWPEVKRAYMRKHERGEWKPGEIQIVQAGRMEAGLISTHVANLATQDTYGNKGVHVKYDAMRECFTKLFDFAEKFGLAVAMPKIGCGLAGGDWDIVHTILLECLDGRNLEVEVFDNA